MDTLEPTKRVLIFQVSLYDKEPFGTITKCVDYTCVLVFNLTYFTVILVNCFRLTNSKKLTQNSLESLINWLHSYKQWT